MTRQIDSPSAVARFAASLLRAALAVAALLLMFGALMLGMAIAACIVLWALLRGRRPGPVNLRWGTAPPWRTASPRQTGEVVDVSAREIDTTPR